MAKAKERKSGDACPNCGSEFIVDEKQAPEALIERKRRNAAVPAAAQRYAEQVTEKTEREGVIHRCPACGYRERFHPKGKAA